MAQDYQAAIKWFKLAVEQSDAIAQTNLGLMYVRGLGVTQDYTRAYMWWSIAASNGDKDAKRNLRKVEQMMTSDQIAAAQELARVCSE